MRALVVLFVAGACKQAAPPPARPSNIADPAAQVDAGVAIDAAATSSIIARIIQVVVGSDTIITVDRGSDDRVARDWTACVVGASERCAPGGELVLIRIDKHRAVLRAKVSPLNVTAAPMVKLSAP